MSDYLEPLRCAPWELVAKIRYDIANELERLQAVVDAARTQREHHDAECLCVVCLAIRAYDGEVEP